MLFLSPDTIEDLFQALNQKRIGYPLNDLFD